MRAAPPPVEFPLGSGRRERSVVALLYSVAAAAFVAWLDSHAQVRVPGWPIALAAIAAGGIGWWLLPPMQGRLAWDGTAWSHLPPAEASRQPLEAVLLQVDLGSWLLLRVRRPDRRASGWCGVTAAQVGAGWHGARLALYFRPPDTSSAVGLR